MHGKNEGTASEKQRLLRSLLQAVAIQSRTRQTETIRDLTTRTTSLTFNVTKSETEENEMYRIFIYNYELDEYEIWDDFDDKEEALGALYDLRFDDCKCYMEKVKA